MGLGFEPRHSAVRPHSGEKNSDPWWARGDKSRSLLQGRHYLLTFCWAPETISSHPEPSPFEHTPNLIPTRMSYYVCACVFNNDEALVCHIWQEGFFHPKFKALWGNECYSSQKQWDPIRKDSLRHSQILIEQLPLMPMNSSLLHALLLLAVIIVVDECWGFFKNQKPFSTTPFISPWKHASDISKCNNVVVRIPSCLDNGGFWSFWLFGQGG